MTINPNQHFVSYLKERNIYFEEDLFEGVPRITMVFTGVEHCPSKRIESWVYTLCDECYHKYLEKKKK